MTISASPEPSIRRRTVGAGERCGVGEHAASLAGLAGLREGQGERVGGPGDDAPLLQLEAQAQGLAEVADASSERPASRWTTPRDVTALASSHLAPSSRKPSTARSGVHDRGVELHHPPQRRRRPDLAPDRDGEPVVGALGDREGLRAEREARLLVADLGLETPASAPSARASAHGSPSGLAARPRAPPRTSRARCRGRRPERLPPGDEQRARERPRDRPARAPTPAPWSKSSAARSRLPRIDSSMSPRNLVA